MILPSLDPDIIDLHDPRAYRRRQLEHMATEFAFRAGHLYENLHPDVPANLSNERHFDATRAAFALTLAEHTWGQALDACPTYDYAVAAIAALEALQVIRGQGGAGWRVWHPKWDDQHDAYLYEGLIPMQCWPRTWPSAATARAAVEHALRLWSTLVLDPAGGDARALAHLRAHAARGFERGLVRSGFPVRYNPACWPPDEFMNPAGVGRSYAA